MNITIYISDTGFYIHNDTGVAAEIPESIEKDGITKDNVWELVCALRGQGFSVAMKRADPKAEVS